MPRKGVAAMKLKPIARIEQINQVRVFCSILALFCFVSMYIPVIAPRYPATEYQAPVGPYEQDFFFNGAYYLAKNYWSLTDVAFAGHHYVMRVLISLEQALLLIWAYMSVKGEVGKKGPVASGTHLLFVLIFLGLMMRSMWGCRWGVVVIIMLNAIAGVLVAAVAE